jgi:hypothetical protein
MPHHTTNEPSGLLIAAIMFGLIVAWLLLMGAVAMLKQYGISGIVRWAAAQWPARPSTPEHATESGTGARHSKRRKPMRWGNGRFAGSKGVPGSGTNRSQQRNDAERGSEDRSAVERGGTAVPTVPIVPENALTVPEMLLITSKLTQGMAPSDVAKSLPGFSGRKYQQYMEEVQKTQTLLAALSVSEHAPSPAPEGEPTPSV